MAEVICLCERGRIPRVDCESECEYVWNQRIRVTITDCA